MPRPDDDLRFLTGIGPVKAAALAAAGLETVADVLHAVPRCLGEAPPLIENGPLPLGAALRVRARVLSVRPSFRRGQGMALEVTVERADGYCLRLRFFNAGFLRRHLLPQEWYLFEGTSDATQAGVLLHPTFIHLAGGVAAVVPDARGCRTAYRLPEGFSERGMAALVEHCLAALPALEDPADLLPAAEYQRRLRDLHRPPDATTHEAARRLVALRELLALAWLLHERRARAIGRPGRAWQWSDAIHARALARLPFALTPGQETALAGIRADMQRPEPMWRLLNGDVGSGKTAVALVAALAVIAEKAQVLLLAPTAVLAAQHHDFCARCLAGSRVRLGLLTGGTAASEKALLITALAAGEIDLLIGTHALLDERVRVRELGLAIIDEQHKFGVAQRAALVARPLAAGGQTWNPDLLLMTATPIPRTLALTAFGDLAVSRIAGRPPGRGTIRTELTAWDDLAELTATVTAALTDGGQAYVICALKTASASASTTTGEQLGIAGISAPQRRSRSGPERASVRAQDAASVVAHLRTALGNRVGLLTGELAEDAKLAALAAFTDGRTPVLVATTVVEVGVDVAAATLLCVLDAERFGLAQLHQLRGRLGRGGRDGLCRFYHHDAPARLTVLAQTDDGMRIAEADLAERGPGQLLGTEQHGTLRLGIADLERDLDLLQDAHDAVRQRLAAGGTCPPGLLRFRKRLGDAGLLAGG